MSLQISLTSDLANNNSIVALHGLGGDAFRTWTAGETLWLRDLLPGQLRNPPDEFKNGPNDTRVARVMTFGYDANIFTDSQNTNAFTIARDLLDDLKSVRLGDVVCECQYQCGFVLI